MLFVVEQGGGAVERVDAVRDGIALGGRGVVGAEEDPLVGGLHDWACAVGAALEQRDAQVRQLKAELSARMSAGVDGCE